MTGWNWDFIPRHCRSLSITASRTEFSFAELRRSQFLIPGALRFLFSLFVCWLRKGFASFKKKIQRMISYCGRVSASLVGNELITWNERDAGRVRVRACAISNASNVPLIRSLSKDLTLSGKTREPHHIGLEATFFAVFLDDE